MKKTILAAAASGLLLSSCGELKEFALPYKLQSVSTVTDAQGNPVDMMVRPADDRVTLTVNLNGIVSSGKPGANGVVKTSSGQSLLNSMCPGSNTLTYTVAVLSSTVSGQEGISMQLNNNFTDLNIVGPQQINVSSASGSTSSTSYRVTQPEQVTNCPLKAASASVTQVSSNTGGTGGTGNTGSALQAIATPMRDDRGNGIRLDLTAFASGRYQVYLTGTYANNQTVSRIIDVIVN